jgi:hypothetical protein
MAHCSHCHSLFFKTLEVRVSKASEILYKKRCKRCKRKALFRKDHLSATLRPLSLADWHAGQKVSLNGYRAQIFVSEYTRKASRPADRQAAYLKQIQQAEEQGHAAKIAQTAG